MKGRGLFLPLSILSPVLMAVGGIIYAITGEMGTLPLSLLWVGHFFIHIFQSSGDLSQSGQQHRGYEHSILGHYRTYWCDVG